MKCTEIKKGDILVLFSDKCDKIKYRKMKKEIERINKIVDKGGMVFLKDIKGMVEIKSTYNNGDNEELVIVNGECVGYLYWVNGEECVIGDEYRE